ncbi:hypothetical protein E2C01_071789 [Portunus trituberculatus]|uniref:Uncharacterized protein n=1 Tax=Portunus trituberculatus TaxID=210409 RepID=A0A5B7I770_PORTR|nr:hypothetical protein [Portunus trituberculatus]
MYHHIKRGWEKLHKDSNTLSWPTCYQRHQEHGVLCSFRSQEEGTGAGSHATTTLPGFRVFLKVNKTLQVFSCFLLTQLGKTGQSQQNY